MKRHIFFRQNVTLLILRRYKLFALCTGILSLWLASCQSSIRFTSATQPENKAPNSTAARTSTMPATKSSNAAPRPAPGLRSGMVMTATQEKILAAAYSWLSVPYRYGSAQRTGTDCSGFTMRVYEEAGMMLPRSAREQYLLGQYVTLNELLPGDLVFFNTTGKGVSHVGLYIGDSTMIHASTKNGVITQSLFDGYYTRTFIAAKRLM